MPFKNMHSLELFTQLIDASNDAVFVINPHTSGFLYVNEQACQTLGYSHKQLLKMSVEDIDPFIKHDAPWPERMKVIKKLGSKVIETYHLRKDKTVFPVEISSRYVRLDEDEYLIAFVRDISQRREAEHQLNLFHHLINQSNDAIFVVNPDTGQIIDINRKACRNLGYPKAKLLTMKVTDISGRVTTKKAWETFSAKLKAEKAAVFESQHIRKDGTVYPIEISAQFVEDKDGDYFIAVSRDITKRKQDLEKLMESYQHVGIINRKVAILSDLIKHKDDKPKKYFSFIVRSVTHFAQEQYGVLYRHDGEGTFSLLASEGLPDIKPFLKIKAEDCTCLATLLKKKKRLLVVKNKRTASQFAHQGLPKGIKAFLLLPLIRDQKLIGALILASDENTSVPTDSYDFYDLLSVQLSHILGEIWHAR